MLLSVTMLHNIRREGKRPHGMLISCAIFFLLSVPASSSPANPQAPVDAANPAQPVSISLQEAIHRAEANEPSYAASFAESTQAKPSATKPSVLPNLPACAERMPSQRGRPPSWKLRGAASWQPLPACSMAPSPPTTNLRWLGARTLRQPISRRSPPSASKPARQRTLTWSRRNLSSSSAGVPSRMQKSPRKRLASNLPCCCFPIHVPLLCLQLATTKPSFPPALKLTRPPAKITLS